MNICANAAGCTILQSRTGAIVLRPINIENSTYRIKKFHSFTHPEISLSVPLAGIDINNGAFTSNIEKDGTVETLNNPLIRTDEQATHIINWVKQWLQMRKTASGEYRADVRLDAGDIAFLESKYSRESMVVITSIEYTFTGAFRGRYIGRIIDQNTEAGYADEIYAVEAGDIIFTREE